MRAPPRLAVDVGYLEEMEKNEIENNRTQKSYGPVAVCSGSAYPRDRNSVWGNL